MLEPRSILRQVERGKLKLDQPVAPLIDPWLRRAHNMSLGQMWGVEMGLVSARTLLQMSSGPCPAQIPFRVPVCAARTLKPTGQSQVTLSLRHEHV